MHSLKRLAAYLRFLCYGSSYFFVPHAHRRVVSSVKTNETGTKNGYCDPLEPKKETDFSVELNS